MKVEPVSANEVVLASLTGEGVRPLGGSDPPQTHVFVFVRSDCPIVNKYAPQLRRVAEEFEQRNVSFWFVYPDPRATPESIRQHMTEYHLPGDALRDPQHQLVRLAGATVTPEVAVFNPNQHLVYCGRIDDRFVDFGRERAAPTTSDLTVAIERAISGQVTTTQRTKAIGCYLRDLQ